MGAIAKPVAAGELLLQKDLNRDRGIGAVNAVRPWSDYQAIMWQPRSLSQYKTLRTLGITGGTVYVGGKDDLSQLEEQRAPLLASNLRWYVENIATDFYSAYHRWSDGKPVNWRFAQAKSVYQKDPNDIAALMRDPSLTDPSWIEKIDRRLTKFVNAEQPYRPLYYSLGDETGIADLSVAWDFDFSPSSLAGFRRYLKDQYPTLAALNREWGSHFTSWGQSFPLTTQEAMRQKDGNFSAWADFKAWMDASFAQALSRGTEAVHRADPNARAGIEGGQDSGWGGYDYSRLAHSVDVFEIYDDAENMAAIRSFFSAKVVLNTSVVAARNQLHELWQKLTRGAGGTILWDPESKMVRADGSATAEGKEIAAVLSKIESGLGSLLITSKPNFDPVAILYSPASLRTRWLLDWQPWGDAWSKRDANSDYDDRNAVRAVMQDDLFAMWHAGVAPRFLTDEAIARGELIRARYRMLILPQSIALSSAASVQIEHFVQRGGVVVAQAQPATYDQHSRRLAHPYLARLFESSSVKARNGRAILLSESAPAERAAEIAARFVPRWFYVSSNTLQEELEIHSWQNGKMKLLSLQQDLPRAGAPDLDHAISSGRSVELRLRRPSYVYDFGSGKSLGRVRRVSLEVDPVEPTFVAIAPKPLRMPAITIHMQSSHSFKIQIRANKRPTSVDVIHFDVFRPDGRVEREYSGNVATRHGVGDWHVALASNVQKGKWRIRVVDSTTGRTASVSFEVH